MLLIFLAIVLVVALAYMLPGFGVSSVLDKIDEYEALLEEQEDDNNVLLNDLKKMGVTPALAERRIAALNDLNAKITQRKSEAARLKGNIMEYKQTYGVDEAWIDGLEFRYAINSDESELLVEYQKSGDVTGETNGSIQYEEKGTGYVQTIKSAERHITITVAESAECYYQTQWLMEGFTIEDIGGFLLFLEHMAAKGSLLIDDFKYSPTDKTGTVDITVLMTETDSISVYKQELEQKEAEEE